MCGDTAKEASGVLPEQMMREMSRSTFCLVPGGDSPDSQRLSIALSVGCIPVIIARFYISGGAREEYTRAYERDRAASTREDFFFFTPFADAIDYPSFAVLVDPVDFVGRPDAWLPDRLAAIAANATLVDAMLLSLARAARHLVYDELGSDVGNMALLSASRHCLARPTDRLPTEEERRAALAAGASWSPDEELGGYL